MSSGLPRPVAPTLVFVFRVEIGVGHAHQLGVVGGIGKRIFPIAGGTIEGPRLRGTVLDGGADWQTVMADGTAYICARYVLQADDGALISVANRGIRRGPAEILDRIMAGEAVDAALYYFRTTPTFDVADGPHRWLGENVFVCSGARTKDQVILDFFQVE